ncbi:MAG: cyclodeaminase/cyclohydrolase family protein [Candidatus Omnitrophica bacterium]|jgi:formiminotetrahydrofolate cyclodeaminase|nr:cyclodeaminase/cyclohydrolase family protein [Candidatus Omnitrophota bacterium]MDD5042115.1 cyclodeaminase/cyclohydrolase family protein [Candidatus Omnitrophota bacterium]MDD5500993.1 cyclodeaminase/cyclohydrolase family protein [Candidatus Omnitrophota bacterium]
MEYKNRSIKKYLNDLSARIPAPGGGSAAALTAAMGAGLLGMAVGFTLGKPRYAKFETELKAILSRSERLAEDFLRLVDLDITAYRSGDARKALDVPLMLARLCYEAAKLCPALLKKGNPALSSDVAIAAVFLESAFSSACINVRINLKSIGQVKLANGVIRELDAKKKTIQRIRKNTEDGFGKIIGG